MAFRSESSDLHRNIQENKELHSKNATSTYTCVELETQSMKQMLEGLGPRELSQTQFLKTTSKLTWRNTGKQ